MKACPRRGGIGQKNLGRQCKSLLLPGRDSAIPSRAKSRSSSLRLDRSKFTLTKKSRS